MTKEELEQITEEITQCEECKKDTVGVPVVGEGNPDAQIVFIGEAPGRLEAETGRPFIGRSGKLLRGLIQDIGFDDLKDVYITSPVKYLPIYVTPKPADIAHGRTHLMKQLEIIDKIVLLGRVAAEGVLQEKVFVQKDHGRVTKKDGRTYFLTLHPAAALRFTKNKIPLVADFQELKKLL
jgi:uracil-DNA glycosylase family 4